MRQHRERRKKVVRFSHVCGLLRFQIVQRGPGKKATNKDREGEKKAARSQRKAAAETQRLLGFLSPARHLGVCTDLAAPTAAAAAATGSFTYK